MTKGVPQITALKYIYNNLPITPNCNYITFIYFPYLALLISPINRDVFEIIVHLNNVIS